MLESFEHSVNGKDMLQPSSFVYCKQLPRNLQTRKFKLLTHTKTNPVCKLIHSMANVKHHQSAIELIKIVIGSLLYLFAVNIMCLLDKITASQAIRNCHFSHPIAYLRISPLLVDSAKCFKSNTSMFGGKKKRSEMKPSWVISAADGRKMPLFSYQCSN